MDTGNENSKKHEIPIIEDAEHAYESLQEIRSAPDTMDNLLLLKGIKVFVEKNKPPIPEKVLAGENGVVSPADYLKICLDVAEHFLENPDVKLSNKVSIALDQAQRLFVHSEARVKIDSPLGKPEDSSELLKNRQMDMPKLVHLHDNWFESERGKELLDLFSTFEKRFQNNQIVSEIDIENLKKMIPLFDEKMQVLSPFKVKEVPLANSIAQILLESLSIQLETQKGKSLKGSNDTRLLFQLLKGTLHFNPYKILTNKESAGGAANPTPAIVRMPLNLKTRLN